MDAPRLLLLVGAGLCAGGAVYWVIALVRVLREILWLPRVREGLALPEPPGGWPKVSVVVPAHDEEALAPVCAEALLASDYPALQAIFVLDRCTDRTLERLRPIASRDPRLVIVENSACPPDWAGKCNAARVGAGRATGEMLLFTDADTRFDPGLVRATVALARHRGLALLSLLPALTSERLFERAVQPVAGMALVRMYPISSANRPTNPRVFANGQFLLFEREVYERLGGHAAVKDDLLEDIAFARAVRDRARAKCGLFVSGPMLVVRMYETLESFIEGWKRIFIEACLRHPGRLRRKAIELLAHGVLLPIVQVATLALAAGAWIAGPRLVDDPPLVATAAALAAGGLLLQWIVVGIVFSASSAPAWGALLYPIGSWYVFRSMWEGAADLLARRPVRWGGREYVLEPRVGPRPAPPAA